MHILIVFHSTYPERKGGINTMISTLISEWSKKGHQVSLFVPGEWSDTEWQTKYHPEITIHKKRLRLPSLPHHSLKGFIAGLIELPQTLWQMYNFCRRNKVDRIHLHTPRTYQLYFSLLRLIGGPPMVLTFHGTDVLSYVEGRDHNMKLIRWIVKRMDALTAVSHHYANLLSHSGQTGKTVHSIANGIALDDYNKPCLLTQEVSDILEQTGDFFLLIVGWIEPPKGSETAVKMWGKLHSKFPNLHLVFIGDQPFQLSGEPVYPGYLKRVQQLAKDLVCDHRLHFVGKQSPDTVRSIMQRGIGLIFPSLWEGMPYVLLEAGAARLPVVCSDIPAFSEIIKPGKNGLLAECENPTAFTKQAEYLLADRQRAKKLGNALHDTIEKKYSAQMMATNYLTFFQTGMDDLPPITPVSGPGVKGNG
jgi:glycosyltransferase involved in cell wall biosynthesis